MQHINGIPIANLRLKMWRRCRGQLPRGPAGDEEIQVQDTGIFISCRLQSTNNISSKSYFPTNLRKNETSDCIKAAIDNN